MLSCRSRNSFGTVMAHPVAAAWTAVAVCAYDAYLGLLYPHRPQYLKELLAQSLTKPMQLHIGWCVRLAVAGVVLCICFATCSRSQLSDSQGAPALA